MPIPSELTLDELFYLSFNALNELPEPVFWFDENGDFFEANSKASEHWGYTREELLNLSVFDLNPKTREQMPPKVTKHSTT